MNDPTWAAQFRFYGLKTKAEAVPESAGGIDGLYPSIEHYALRQFIDEERHQPPATSVHLHVASPIEMDKIDLLRRGNVVARLHVELRRWSDLVT